MKKKGKKFKYRFGLDLGGYRYNKQYIKPLSINNRFLNNKKVVINMIRA